MQTPRTSKNLTDCLIASEIPFTNSHDIITVNHDGVNLSFIEKGGLIIETFSVATYSTSRKYKDWRTAITSVEKLFGESFIKPTIYEAKKNLESFLKEIGFAHIKIEVIKEKEYYVLCLCFGGGSYPVAIESDVDVILDKAHNIKATLRSWVKKYRITFEHKVYMKEGIAK